jgi:hypothetical protein
MLKRYKLPRSDQILAELIKVGGETWWFEIHFKITCWSEFYQ